METEFSLMKKEPSFIRILPARLTVSPGFPFDEEKVVVIGVAAEE